MKKASILSLSLLTVMAGAAVAPALGVIRAYFSDSSALMIQLIISMPAVFIFLTSFVFPSLTRRFSSKKLVMAGLAFYVVGGCLAGVFDHIGMVLVFRALVGIGVGIIMPLSTGLLAFYYPPSELDKLMGLSSAMNQMGGVIATLISGVLAAISWRASFLVYMLGLICVVLCAIFLPDDYLGSREEPEEPVKAPAKGAAGVGSEAVTSAAVNDQDPDAGSVTVNHQDPDAGSATVSIRNRETEEGQIRRRHPLIRYYAYIGAMFLLMMTFFLYPANFAIETLKEGVVGQQWIAVIMAFMDFVAFLGGLCFVKVKGAFGRRTMLVSPVLFLLGFLALALLHGWTGPVIGSIFVGFANGNGVPAIISEASQKAGKSAVSTVMPLLSAAIYLGQFVAPFAMSAVSSIFAGIAAAGGAAFHLPYCFAIGLALLQILWVLTARK